MVSMRLSSRPRTAVRVDSDIIDNWRWHGNCASLDDPDVMYPSTHDTVGEMRAVKVCDGCPVINRCGQWALKNAEQHGVWAGMTERERAHRLADHATECPKCRHRHFQRHCNQVYCLACRIPPSGTRAERMTPDTSTEEEW